MRPLLPLLLALTGCGLSPPRSERALVWTAREFKASHTAAVDFGGWRPAQFLMLAGEPLAFLPNTPAAQADGLTLFAGVSDGVSAPFVITDVWQNHPQPWVQPVWSPRDELGKTPETSNPDDAVLNLFPVDVDSTFYSPYWQLEELVTPGLTSKTYRTARDVLNAPASVVRRHGALVLCPIVPEGVGLAGAGDTLTDPASLRALAPPTAPRAYVEGNIVHYLAFGLDRVETDGQNLVEAPAYFFVAQQDGRRVTLPIAAVLPSSPLRHALVRRVDVDLDALERITTVKPGAYVPSARPELRTVLGAFAGPVPSAANDDVARFTLRVALNPSCFTATDFPGSCQWLDSAASVEALSSAVRSVTDVQATLGVLEFKP